MKKIAIYGAGNSATYEEIGAIELLKSNGVQVEVLLHPDSSEADLHTARIVLSALGVHVSRYAPGDFQSLSAPILSFGRPEIFQIVRKFSDKPQKLVYGEASPVPTPSEIKANADGLIDELFVKGFNSVEVVKRFVRKSKRGVEFRAGYTPFCNPTSDYFHLSFQKQRPDCFHVMRCTPDEAGFAFPDHWLMVGQITCPHPREKRFHALNWGKKLSKAVGDPCAPNNFWGPLINVTVEPPSVDWSIEKDTLYKSSALVHFYPEEELFSFAAAKAMLAGTVVVASPSPAFLELLRHDETGFFAKTPDEAAYYTSKLAWDPFLRAKIANSAYTWFTSDGPGNPDKCLRWWKEGGFCG